MRTVTEAIELFTFTEASAELRDKIRANFEHRDNLYEHCMEERILTLKKLAEVLNGNLDYSISYYPDRGEFITITGFNNALLRDLINSDKDCPLTGVCYDMDIIEQLKIGLSLSEVLNNYLKSIHNEYESMLEDDYLLEHCEANEYEFTINGEIY